MAFLKSFILFLTALSFSLFGQSVLILEDGSTEDSVQAILSEQGIASTLGGNYWDYTGVNIQNYRVVILLNGYDYNISIPDSAETRIRDFVSSGGKLLTTEWLAYYFDTYPILSGVLPVNPASDFGQGVETYKKAADHPICAGLNDSFTTLATWFYSRTTRDTSTAKQATTIFTGSLSGDAVVEGVFGSGKVVHWNMGGHYGSPGIWNRETRQLLVNIIAYLSGNTGVELANPWRAAAPLLRNHPNPFNRATTFQYPLTEAGRVSLKVYDLMGREVATLVNFPQNPGFQSVGFSATGLGAGAYYCRLSTGKFEAAKRFVILR